MLHLDSIRKSLSLFSIPATWVAVASVPFLMTARWLGHGCFVTADSSIFLYIAQQLLAGRHLYTEVWDHKPPMIFWINEAGLFLANESEIGVLLLSACALSAWCLILLLLSRNIAPPWCVAGALMMALYTSQRALLFHTNLTEVFALPAQAMALYLMFRQRPEMSSRLNHFLLGVLFAYLFTLRANLIGVAVLYVVHLFLVAKFSSLKDRVLALGACGAGFLLLFAAVAAPFVLQDRTTDLAWASIGFNIEYSRIVPGWRRVVSIAVGLDKTAMYGLAALAVMGLLASFREKRSIAKPSTLGLASAMLWIIEALFSTISGRNYEHYFILWLTPMTLLAAIGLRYATASLHLRGAAALLAVLYLALIGSETVRKSSAACVESTDEVALKIQSMTGQWRRVQTWGFNGARLLYQVRAAPGSSIFSTVPLEHGAHAYRDLALRILTELERRPAELIVEAASDRIPPLLLDNSLSLQRDDWDTAELKALKQKIQLQYEIVPDLCAGRYSVYRLVELSHAKAVVGSGDGSD